MESWASQVVLVGKSSPANTGDVRDVSSVPGSGRSPEEGGAIHPIILAWRVPGTEEPAGCGSQGCKKLDTTEGT